MLGVIQDETVLKWSHMKSVLVSCVVTLNNPQECKSSFQSHSSMGETGDTRPWVSMYRWAEAVEASYDVLVTVLTTKNRLELVANVNRSLNRAIMQITGSIKEIFESLEKGNEETLHLVVPSYYLLSSKLHAQARQSTAVQTFLSNLQKYLDDKF